MKYEAVIGLEVHAQVLTESKIFCGCSTKFGQPPNSQTCPICLGHPGVLPVLNQKVVENAIRMGVATHCQIAPHARFARKNYFYPDLPKGYQISMYELPLAEHGYIEIAVNGATRRIGLTRIHMEEDAGKNLHEGIEAASHVDLNRAGVPLLEIVSEPDIRTSDEAVAYLKKLRQILIYTGVSDADMEKGNFRCDANVSIRPVGSEKFGTRAEVKNMNSFRFIQKAIEYEMVRQEKILEEGGKIVQETRLWDTKSGMTFSMRSKEAAHDYRYFPEPDLVPLAVDQKWIDTITATLPELPDAKRARFVSAYQIPDYDAVILTGSEGLADFFEKAVKAYPKPKIVSNWVMGDLLRELNNENKEIEQAPIRPEQLAAMLKMIEDGTISGKIAKTVFEEMYRSGADPEKIVQEKGLVQMSDTSALEGVIDEVMTANPKEVEGYRAGKEKLLGFFVGQVMKRSGGKANPGMLNELLKRKLAPK
ncbi:MAG: Asp-tRNA(Asn)/Glu-tRNA(Gln) amidotransferase subunit GatB [Nitrospirae bacterium]|nr:Asp-tRNA(Asn)/Glu-tRNA(Gln) amidotransferase subunit GatB [Candidatus Manganitrophaceae bacterium]